MLGALAADRVEEGRAHLGRDRTQLAVADRAAVDRLDPRDLDPGAAEEGLLGKVELGPIDLALLGRDSCLLRELEDRPPGDPFEDVGG